MKFLADENFPHIAVKKLRALGWDVRELVLDVPELRGGDDVTKVLTYAKRSQRVLLSSDMFDDRDTRTRLRENIRRTKRGRVISVAGGPQKVWTQIVGKLLFHQERWEQFLEQGHGIVRIGDLKPDQLRMNRPEELDTLRHAPVKQGERYVRRPRQPRLRKVTRTAPIPRAGAPLDGLG